jgi:hypothetical protein
MDIIDRLKKGKKNKSVLDSLTKNTETKPDDEQQQKQASNIDVEVRELNPSTEKMATPQELDMHPVDTQQIREFRTEGMHEFELDSLGASSDANIKVEYKSRVNTLIDKGKVDEAIILLQDLKQKLAEKKEQ